MELTEKHIELLEKMFFQQLSDQEKVELTELYKDPNWAEEAARHLALFKGISSDADTELKRKMTSWETQENKTTIWSLKRIPLVKAAAALVLIAGTIFYLNTNSNSATELNAYYEPYPDRLSIRASGGDSALDLAMLLYSEKKYSDAREILENRMDESSLIYKAHCSFNLGEYKKAIQDYDALIRNSTSWKETAEWYTILSELKLDEFDRSSKSYRKLKELASSEHAYHNQAADLLRLLRTQ